MKNTSPELKKPIYPVQCLAVHHFENFSSFGSVSKVHRTFSKKNGTQAERAEIAKGMKHCQTDFKDMWHTVASFGNRTQAPQLVIVCRENPADPGSRWFLRRTGDIRGPNPLPAA